MSSSWGDLHPAERHNHRLHLHPRHRLGHLLPHQTSGMMSSLHHQVYTWDDVIITSSSLHLG